MTCTLPTNVMHVKDDTFKNSKALRSIKDIMILSRDKDSLVVILNKDDYVNKVQGMLNKGIVSGKYAKSTDTVIKDLKPFQSFLSRNFSGCLTTWKKNWYPLPP